MEAARVETRPWRWDRYAPLTGIAAVVLWVLGIFLEEASDPPRDEDERSGEALMTWFTDNETEIVVANVIFIVGCLAFMWFIASLASSLRAVEGLPGRLSSLAFAGGMLAGFSLIVSAASRVQGAIEGDDLTPDSALTLDMVGNMFFGGAEMTGVLLMLGAALAILRTRLLPAWLAWFSLFLAVLLLIVPIGWIGVIAGLPIWTLITSVLLFRRPAAV